MLLKSEIKERKDVNLLVVSFYDKKMHHNITPEHFGLWLNEWFATIDELFEGEVASIAKNRAQKMSTMLYMNIYQHRARTN